MKNLFQSTFSPVCSRTRGLPDINICIVAYFNDPGEFEEEMRYRH